MDECPKCGCLSFNPKTKKCWLCDRTEIEVKGRGLKVEKER